MSSDAPQGKPDELTSEDLVSVPGTMAAAPRPTAPSKPTPPLAPPAPRKTAPTPPTPSVSGSGSTAAIGTQSLPRQVEGQMIRGPRHGTLVGMGGAPRVDETERLVTGPMSPLDTQRRLVEQRIAQAALANDEKSAEASAAPAPSPVAPPVAPAIDVPPPPIESAPPSDSGQAEVHPPITPPKPTEMPAEVAPKVVVDAPGAERVIPENLKATSISLRRVQPPLVGVPSGEHATVIDPARRARGRAIVAAVVGVCGLLLIVGIVVSIVRRHKNDDDDTASKTSSTASSAHSKSNTKSGDDDGATSSGSSATTTSGSATAATSTAPSGAVPKGFGRLTVEPQGKPAPATALVFIGEKSYGPLGQPIFVPCGYRWIMAGVPSAKGRLATRLSKAYSVFVQCGASGDTHYKLTLK